MAELLVVELSVDSVTDVAVIKIEANNLPSVTFADITNLEAGEWAIAIGNPLGLDNKEQLKTQRNIDIQADRGVLVVGVVPNSPADRAGLKSGDIIQKLAGQTVSNPNEVQEAVEKTQVGSNLSLSLERNQQALDLNVQVGILYHVGLINHN
jgi:S1-C subfamily serine protease